MPCQHWDINRLVAENCFKIGTGFMKTNMGIYVNLGLQLRDARGVVVVKMEKSENNIYLLVRDFDDNSWYEYNFAEWVAYIIKGNYCCIVCNVRDYHNLNFPESK